MATIVKTGTVTGTGAAINVSIGFEPDYVKVINDTAGAFLEWYSSMTDGHGYKRVAAGTGTKITANGISIYAGSDTAAKGFTLGTDVDVNVNAVALRYIAISDGPGAG